MSCQLGKGGEDAHDLPNDRLFHNPSPSNGLANETGYGSRLGSNEGKSTKPLNQGFERGRVVGIVGGLRNRNIDGQTLDLGLRDLGLRRSVGDLDSSFPLGS